MYRFLISTAIVIASIGAASARITMHVDNVPAPAMVADAATFGFAAGTFSGLGMLAVARRVRRIPVR
jgi:hypothetical protein